MNPTVEKFVAALDHLGHETAVGNDAVAVREACLKASPDISHEAPGAYELSWPWCADPGSAVVAKLWFQALFEDEAAFAKFAAEAASCINQGSSFSKTIGGWHVHAMVLDGNLRIDFHREEPA